MSQVADLLDLFILHGHKLTLGQILQTKFAAEYRARMTDLRKRGFTIILQRGKRPSDNLYRICPPDGSQMRFI